MPIDLPSRALSLRLPWDFAILQMSKDIENRSRSHSFRGPVLIHTSSWWQEEEVAADLRFCFDCAHETSASYRSISMDQLRARRGKITGMIEVVDCVTSSRSPWFFGPIGFVLRNPVIFKKPEPCKGALGFFPVPEAVRAAIAAAEGFANA